MEVDLIIEEGSRVIAVEMKSAASIARDFFTSLRRLKNDISAFHGHVEFAARVVYGGDSAQTREGTSFVPWDRVHNHAW